MQEIVKVRMYSRDRLVFAGIDLLHLQKRNFVITRQST